MNQRQGEMTDLLEFLLYAVEDLPYPGVEELSSAAVRLGFGSGQCG